MFSRWSVPCTNSGQANGERKYQILFNWPSAFWLVVFTNYTLPKQYTPLTAIQNFVGETCAAPKPPWGMKNYYCHFFKGDTGKQALKLICLQFLQFLSNFNETLSISFSFWGRLNRALRSDLTPLHSAHFMKS